ncbi:hypothetical protein JIG36_18670 [Actinoplanes sp. LDG1-06]|uniref:Sulfotransferase family protein n=1 Tax=Paractinoplanes ovalisporus TaxID=2810368 RepID=A0ABS2ACM8_9ACTN|nr:hypothetical protein [Actinoplanes ovalisporus]MBM2617581.1 hypothetical protein [Actinoplanes ovalisporus]
MFDEPDAADLALARWEVATLTGRLRCVEDERDAAVRDRDRNRELVLALRRSRSYRLGRALVDLARDPMRFGPSIAGRAARRLRRRAVIEAVRPRTPQATPVPARVYVAIGLSRSGSHALIRALRQRVLVDADHLPVVVTDQPALRGLQVPGVVLEYLPDPATWSRHDPVSRWETLLAGRVAQLCRDHHAARAVVIDPRDPPTLARLLESAA